MFWYPNYFFLLALSLSLLLVQQQAFAGGKLVQYSGRLISADLAAMARDGDGIFKVQTDGQTITVHLTSGESDCDREAIAIPGAKPGDMVSVSGVEESTGFVRVCVSGTYIK
ncbi:MAG TPA: hypothetical protein VFT64_06940 [Rickettsiales bacterium]|nr:hypothetical protein [Rickettsiales bacterium]